MNRDLNTLRENYKWGNLDAAKIDLDPINQFDKWISQAINDGLTEPNAMTLCTVDTNCLPDGRIVLLKEFSQVGFVFYTNYNSVKGQQLANNPNATLVFLWKEHERQVRIKGVVKKTSREATESYFQSRPRSSQLGAWTSQQSEVVPNRSTLTTKYSQLEEKYSTLNKIPTPPHWGGYIVKPMQIEFWQGQTSRLHDRIKYIFVEGKWQIVRLAP